MIRGMVERLAARLQRRTARTSRDGCGWCAPIWCWATATRRDAAADEARRALASDPDKVRQIDELAKGLGLEG